MTIFLLHNIRRYELLYNTSGGTPPTNPIRIHKPTTNFWDEMWNKNKKNINKDEEIITKNIVENEKD